MNLSDLTPEQRDQVLHHFRAAVRARALQWDHERQIELLLDRELDLGIEDYAGGVDVDAESLSPEDLTFIGHDDLAFAIPDEDEE